MHINILRGDIYHVAAIATIGKKAFREAFEETFVNKDDLAEYLERTYEPLKIANSLRKENNVYLLARVKDEVIGFVKAKKHSLNKQIESPTQMELQKLYIMPAWQGRGAGKLLLEEVTALANQLQPDYVWLDTPITNHRAIRLYEKNGFNKLGKHFFTIGSQTFEYHVMGLPIAIKKQKAVNV